MAHKKSHAKPSAKLASNKQAKQNFAVADATRQQAEKVVKLGSGAVQDFLSTSADEAQKTQEQLLSFSREGAQNMAKSADAVTKALYDTIAISRENIEACIECGNVAAALTKDLSSEVFENANRAFSESAELSKDFLACRTLSDMIELNNRLLQQATDQFFNQSARLSNLVFEYTTEALEPINERVNRVTKQISKSLAA